MDTEPTLPVSSEHPELTSLAYEAWTFGLPMVEHFKLFSLYRTEFSPVYRDWNEFFHVRNLMTPDMQSVVSPNTDTLMSLVLFDLRAGPALIETPKLNGRYFSLQLIDICTNSFGYIGTRTTGDEAQSILLYHGDDDFTYDSSANNKITSPSALVLGICRTAVNGKEDLPEARALQNALRVSTLPKGPKPSAIQWPTYYDVKFQDDLGFFDIMNFMMQWHQFSPSETNLLTKLSKVGIAPGQKFDRSLFSSSELQAIQLGMTEARRFLEAQSLRQKEPGSCWSLPHASLGNFAEEYELRALTAWNFLYANINEEATYIRAYCDSQGATLDASSNVYAVNIDKSKIPQDIFFWSMTLYDGKSYYLCKNEIKRYSVGDRTPGIADSKHSNIKVVIAHEQQNEEDGVVWLPAPKGSFYLALRFYGLSKLEDLNLPPIEKQVSTH